MSSLDYYRTLQVHPEAEQDVIEAAYRRLMRKYHPDTLDARQKQDPEMQRKALEINEAYAVLGDPQQRAEYDRSRQPGRPAGSTQSFPPIENPEGKASQIDKRIYQVRCAKTKQGFQMLLARKRGSAGPFRVMGFEPIPESRAVTPSPEKSGGLLQQLLGSKASPSKKTTPPLQRTGFPTDKELEAMFDESQTLEMGDIDWAGHTCPACNAEFVNSDGRHMTWFRCGRCAHLYCAGSTKQLLNGVVGTCPWCGNRGRLTTIVKPGEKSQKPLPLQGKVIQNDPANTRPQLPGGKDDRGLPPPEKKK